jgi:hypothetical protein
MYKISVCVINIICVFYHARSLRITVTFLFRFISVRGEGVNCCNLYEIFEGDV